MSRVWEYSKVGGTDLLVLLSIADFANDTGAAWPSISTIARKSRISDRQTKRVIKQLEEAGELGVERGTGPKRTNTYIILTGLEYVEPEVKCYMCGATRERKPTLKFDRHHRIKDDDSSIVILCSPCHIKVHRLLRRGNEEGVNLSPHDKTRKKGDAQGQEGDTTTSPDPLLDPSLDPSSGAPSKKKLKPRGAKLLQATLTVPEGEHQRSQLAEYIGQQMGSPVPSGQRKQLAMTYTEQTTNGPIKHPSPDELWDKKHAGYRSWVAERIEFYKGISATPAIRRKRLVNRLCNYKTPDGFGWLDRRGKRDERMWVDV
jgi:hypothetical protein